MPRITYQYYHNIINCIFSQCASISISIYLQCRTLNLANAWRTLPLKLQQTQISYRTMLYKGTLHEDTFYLYRFILNAVWYREKLAKSILKLDMYECVFNTHTYIKCMIMFKMLSPKLCVYIGTYILYSSSEMCVQLELFRIYHLVL